MAETHHKAVLITGAGKRIGRALAEALAADGWAIAAHYAGSKSEAKALVADITDKGGKAVALQADLRDAAAVETLVTDAAAALGPLSALINNASTFERDTAHTLTAESWDTHINANLRAPALLMRDFANQAALQNDGLADACIINITDQRVDRLTPDFTSYTVSKTGLATLTETFAQALAPQHIRVNAIAPGRFYSKMTEFLSTDQAAFDEELETIPMRRWGEASDIAGVAIMLASPAGAFITGQIIPVDGGTSVVN